MGCGGSKDTNVEVKEDKKYTPSPAPSAAKTEDVKVEVKSEPKKAEGPARRAGVSAETGEDTTASAKRKKSSVEAMTKPKTEEGDVDDCFGDKGLGALRRPD